MKDPATQIEFPRILSAAYFSMLGIIAALIIDAYIEYFQLVQLVSLSQSVLLAGCFSALFGALFGKKILYCENHILFKSFFWGLVMSLCALPFHALSLLFLLPPEMTQQLSSLSGLEYYTSLYSMTLTYSFFLAGFWLCIAAGFAAMLLRKEIVYAILAVDEKSPSRTSKKPYRAAKTSLRH